MELTRRLILSRISGKDGKILIPFAGSGSECVVAQALRIEYFGIEMNPEFVDFAMKWLEYERKEQITLKLFEHTANLSSTSFFSMGKGK